MQTGKIKTRMLRCNHFRQTLNPKLKKLTKAIFKNIEYNLERVKEQNDRHDEILKEAAQC